MSEMCPLFSSIPPEITAEILEYLSPQALIHLSQTSKSNHTNVYSYPKIWRSKLHLYHLEYIKIDVLPSSQSSFSISQKF